MLGGPGKRREVRQVVGGVLVGGGGLEGRAYLMRTSLEQSGAAVAIFPNSQAQKPAQSLCEKTFCGNWAKRPFALGLQLLSQ